MMILGTINPFVYQIEYAKWMRASAKCAQINRIELHRIIPFAPFIHSLVHSFVRQSIGRCISSPYYTNVPLKVLKCAHFAHFDIILWVSRVLIHQASQPASHCHTSQVIYSIGRETSIKQYVQSIKFTLQSRWKRSRNVWYCCVVLCCTVLVSLCLFVYRAMERR